MKKTNTKILALLALGALIANIGSASATVIGTPTVTDDTVVNPTIVDVDWDDTFGGTGNAVGSVAGIVIKAVVTPVLNMAVSTEEIDLGVLAAGVESTGSLNIEIGTNASTGVTITARSTEGGLESQTDNTIHISSNTTDGLAESYTYASTSTIDSPITGFTSTGDLTAIEVVDDTTEHTIYTTNKGEPTTDLNDVTFTVGATSNAATPAGDYQDTVTFTVSGNF